MPIETRRVLVLGATGAQGGSLARRLTQINRYSHAGAPYAVRALTRNALSPAAAALSANGVEVLEGTLDSPRDLRAALDGCDLIFGVTNYWEHGGGEVVHGLNLVDAVAAAGGPHLVLSSLPSARRISGELIDVPHFETKAVVERHARERIENLTVIHVAFYYENLLGWLGPRPRPNGTLAFGFPQGTTPLAAVSAEDVGAVVEALFQHPDRFRGATIGVVGDDLPPANYAAAMSRALGAPVVYEPVTREDFARSAIPGAADLAAMFELNRRFILTRALDQAVTRRLHPGALSFADWAGINEVRLRRALAPAMQAA